MKNIFFIAITLVISVSTASAADTSFNTDSYISQKRAEANELKESSDKKLARYKHLIENKQTIVTGIRVNAIPKVSSLETASGGSSGETSKVGSIPSGK